MVKLDKKTWKENYFTKLKTLMGQYGKVLIVGVDNIRSKQMQETRMDIRGKGELLMGKNTMIRKCFREMQEEYPYLTELLPSIVNNIGFCFTDMDLSECRDLLVKNKVQASAKAGIVAPVDVVIPKGVTAMGPEKTSFFQALNLNTKITKGMIEILQDTVVCKVGEKVGLSEAKLLNMLNISPFFYGLELQLIVDNGSVYPPAVLDLTPEDIIAKFQSGVNNVASLALAAKFPCAASAPHSILNGFKNLLAIAVTTDYTFEEAAKVKAYLENPDAFAAAAPAAGGGGGDTAAAAAAPPPPESESEEDMEMGLFD